MLLLQISVVLTNANVVSNFDITVRILIGDSSFVFFLCHRKDDWSSFSLQLHKEHINILNEVEGRRGN